MAKISKQQEGLLAAIRNNTARKGIQSNTQMGRTLGALIRKGLVAADETVVKGGPRLPGRPWPRGFVCYRNVRAVD